MKTAPTLFIGNENSVTAHAFVGYAIDYAAQAHGNQKRKYTGVAYVTHCINVCEIVAKVTNDAEIIAAAALHDTIEDTAVTFTDIILSFGPRVARMVMEVTNVSRAEDGNRATRKAIDIAHIAKSSPEGATIKLADLIDNSRDIVQHDENFARVYLKEKAKTLEVLRHGNADLYRCAQGILEDGFLQISIAA